MSGEYLNNLRAFLLGGDGAPVGAPDGLLATSGLTIEQLAHACGITRTAIYSYIERKSRPTTPTLRRIAQALGVRFDQALGYCTPAQVGRPPRGDLRPMRPSETTSPEVVVARQASRGIRRGAYDRRSEAQKERQKFQRQELFRTIKRPNSNERGGAGQEGFRMKEDSNLPARGSSSRVFALELKRLMSKHDPPLDIKELAASIPLSYEHTRKLVRGLCTPSGALTRDLARFFGVAPQRFADLVKRDRFDREYGGEFEIPVSNPGLREIVSEWDKLANEQKGALLTMLEAFVAQQRKSDSRDGP